MLDALLEKGLLARGYHDLTPGHVREHAIAAVDARLLTTSLALTDLHRAQVIATLPAEDFVLLLVYRFVDAARAGATLAAIVPPLLTAAYRRLGASTEAAETRAMELLENLLVGAFRKSGQPGFLNYEARSSLPAWLSGVALHDWRSQQRAQRARPRSLDATDDPSPAISLPDRRAVAVDRASEARELARVLLHSLRAALERGEFEPVDVAAFARATLSRRTHLELAVREAVSPSAFSRRKDRGAAGVARVVRAELTRRGLGEEPDLLIEDADGVIRRFCRDVIRGTRRRPDPKGPREVRR
jgi:DNA-directed RNA polymerase specialized sigma24 family protein